MKRFVLATTVGIVVLTGCDDRPPFTEPPSVAVDAELRRSIGQWGVIPIGAMPAHDPAQVRLGRALFFDKILSGNRDVACATCHQPAAALGDGLSLSVGTGGTGQGTARTLGPGRQFVPRSAPTLLNVGLGLFYVFWDGRLTRFGGGTFVTAQQDTIVLTDVSDVLAAQAMLPVLNRTEMRGERGDTDVFGQPNELAEFGEEQHEEVWDAVMQRLLVVPEYLDLFRDAFPETAGDQFRFQQAAEALAVFQKDAFTRTNSPFDRYLDRDDTALTPEEKRGALLFFGEAQCGSCHNGPFLGGQSFSNVGAPQVGPGIGKELPLDLGRGELDDFEFYRFAFRVPPLRNVELTAPYMHSGAFPTLEAVVEHYNDVPVSMREYDVSHLRPELRDAYHGDDATIGEVLRTVDGRLLLTLDLSDTEQRELVAFLESLTDPDARDLRSVIPARVPSGLPVQN